jgi:hypothetical protein
MTSWEESGGGRTHLRGDTPGSLLLPRTNTSEEVSRLT